MEKKFKIRKDDTVEVIAGKDKGKRGQIVRVIRDKDRVIVAGVNGFVSPFIPIGTILAPVFNAK